VTILLFITTFRYL